MYRRTLLGMSVLPWVIVAASKVMAESNETIGDTPAETAEPVAPPSALSDELVREFVGVAHGDLEKVKSLLAGQPKLVNAVWDWGGGDFESALGAAAHMGRADIARYLLSNGARLDLFAAAMLGELAVVRAILSAFPEAVHVPGPHGIPLIVHARQGGEAAAGVLAYLETFKTVEKK